MKIIDFTPFDLNLYDNVEIEELVEIDGDCLRVFQLEKSELENVKTFFSVYGHLITGHVDWIADFETCDNALEFAILLIKHLPNYNSDYNKNLLRR